MTIEFLSDTEALKVAMNLEEEEKKHLAILSKALKELARGERE